MTYSSDDEAPEAIPMDQAKEQALKTMRQEKESRKLATKKVKKTKKVDSVQVEDPKPEETSVPVLSTELLDQALQEKSEKQAAQEKKVAVTKKKVVVKPKMHKRSFQSVDVVALEGSSERLLKTKVDSSAMEFANRMQARHRKRVPHSKAFSNKRT